MRRSSELYRGLQFWTENLTAYPIPAWVSITKVPLSSYSGFLPAWGLCICCSSARKLFSTLANRPSSWRGLEWWPPLWYFYLCSQTTCTMSQAIITPLLCLLKSFLSVSSSRTWSPWKWNQAYLSHRDIPNIWLGFAIHQMDGWLNKGIKLDLRKSRFPENKGWVIKTGWDI